MQRRKPGSLLLLLALCWVWTGTAFAMGNPTPFEDPATQLWGYRNARGAVVIAPRYTVAQHFSEAGIAAVADNYGWKIINRQGKTLVRPYLVDNGPDPFQQGLARFKEAGKVGFYNERGKVVIPPRFTFAGPFSNGRAAFCQGCRERSEGEHHAMHGGSWGYIDKKGKVLIPARFEAAEPFHQEKARVMLNGHWITVDRQGRRIGW